MRIRTALFALVLVATQVEAAARPAELPGPAFPTFASPAALDAACQHNVATVGAAIKALERRPPGPDWLARYDDINALAEDLSGPIFLLSNVHPDKPMRDASEACELRWQDLLSSLAQNERLYQAARRLKPRDAIDREFLRLTLESFEDSGVSLTKDKRARAKAIVDRVTELDQQFSKNIRDENVRVAFSEAELAGVPDNVWKSAKRDDQGRVLLGLDYPTSVPVLQAAQNPSTRERMWRAKNNEGGQANLALLAEIAQLRREYARLFGFASYADFTLRRRMAENTVNAKRFLEDVRLAVTEREKRELGELREAKARDLGRSLADVKLERWDTSYYTERVKRDRYSVDQHQFRPYFPPQESLALVMRVIEKVMGVRYTRVTGVTLWHPDAQAYVASDVKTGRSLATLYVDPYPRDGKYNHAAVWPIRSGSTRLHRAPQAALVVNFDRQGLSLDEMETLLHEFGHAVHNNLSTTRHSSGSNVLRDFVEAPSQMLEEWVYDPRVLALMREVCPVCKRVPDDLLAKAKVSERYGKGAQYARQHLFASFDLALYDADAPEPMALWQRMEGATVLGHVPGHHVAGWVFARRWGLCGRLLRLPVERGRGSRSPKRRSAKTSSTRGSAGATATPCWPRADSDHRSALVRAFLGRDSNAEAFFEDLKR